MYTIHSYSKERRDENIIVVCVPLHARIIFMFFLLYQQLLLALSTIGQALYLTILFIPVCRYRPHFSQQLSVNINNKIYEANRLCSKMVKGMICK